MRSSRSAPVVAALRDARRALPRGEPGAGQLFELCSSGSRERRPVLLVLEDLHWADRSTLALLAFLARNLRDERIVVLATYRVDDELPPALRRLAAELGGAGTVARIELDAARRDADVARQLEAIAGGPVAAALADELHARAGGNPFFVEELFAARAPATLRGGGAGARSRGSTPRDARACSPRPAGARPTRCSSGSAVDPAAALRAALDAGVLVRERDGVAFRHGLIGEVALRAPAARRAGGAAPRDRGARSTMRRRQRAHHCHRAGLRERGAGGVGRGGERRGGGVRLRRGAAVHFERALELGRRATARAARPRRPGRALQRRPRARGRAVPRGDRARPTIPRASARLYERLGEFHFWDDEAALECYERALALAPGRAAAARRAKGHALMGLRRWEEARACCEAALAAGAGPRITLGSCSRSSASRRRARRTCGSALELATVGEDTARAYLHLGELLRVARRPRRRAGRRWSTASARRRGSGCAARSGTSCSSTAPTTCCALGRWDEAAARLAGGRADGPLAHRCRAAPRDRGTARTRSRGDSAAARAELDGAADDGLPSEFLAPLAAARAALALAEGRPRRGAPCTSTARSPASQDPFYTPPLYAPGASEAATDARAERPTRSLADLERAARMLTRRSRSARLAGAAPGARPGRAPAPRGAPAPARCGARRPRRSTRCGEPYPAAYARLHAGGGDLLARRPRGRRCARPARHAHAPPRGWARGRCRRRPRRSPGARGSDSAAGARRPGRRRPA